MIELDFIQITIIGGGVRAYQYHTKGNGRQVACSNSSAAIKSGNSAPEGGNRSAIGLNKSFAFGLWHRPAVYQRFVSTRRESYDGRYERIWYRAIHSPGQCFALLALLASRDTLQSHRVGNLRTRQTLSLSSHQNRDYRVE